MTTPVVVLITDPRYELACTVSVVRAAAQALGAGRLLVQLRDRQASEAALLAPATALREVTHEVGALLVINGPLTVARAVAADGVHFPNQGAGTAARVADARAHLGGSAFVTTTAHSDEDVRHAILAEATAVLVSPVFDTPGKGPPRGVGALVAARASVDAARHVPPMLVYALGGVTHENAKACAGAGADGVAAIRSIYEGDALALGRAFTGAGRSRMP